MMRPWNAYFLCSTPRSGSTLLCRALQQTGKLGAPDEFYSPDTEDNWGAAPEATIRQLIAERTVNGVFGIKTHFNEFMPLYLSRHMEALRPAKYLFLERADKVAQAVSLVKADQTGWWNSLQSKPSAKPRYDYDEILRALHFILEQNHAWSAFFAANDITRLSITYERFLDAPGETVRLIGEYLDVAVDTALIDLGRLSLVPQRDESNAAWRAQFIAETGERMKQRSLAAFIGTAEGVRRTFREPTARDLVLERGLPMFRMTSDQRASERLRAQETLARLGYLAGEPEAFVHRAAADAAIAYQRDHGWMVDPRMPPWFTRTLLAARAGLKRLNGVWAERSNALAQKHGGSVEIAARGGALRLDGHYGIDDGTTVRWTAVLEQVVDFEFQGPLVHDRETKRRGWGDATLHLRLSPDEKVLAGTTTPEGGPNLPFVLERTPVR
jgi:LPS sulfotransferase NodH